MAEWLRRLTRNQMGSSRAGSNPAGCEILKLRKKSYILIIGDLFLLVLPEIFIAMVPFQKNLGY